MSTNAHKYDLQLTDYVHLSSRANGGKHSGEPLDMPGTTGSNPNPAYTTTNVIFENGNWVYCEYLNGGSGTVRPSYNSEGIAADLTVRMRH